MYVSIGYGNQQLHEFLQSLADANITVVVDTISSKSRPEMHEDANYEACGIKLVHEKKRMSGHRSRKDAPDVPLETNAGWEKLMFRYVADYYMTDTFQEALCDMIALHDATEGNLGFMCCESVPWRCHRNLISAHLAAEVGSDQVVHLIGQNLKEHKVWGPKPVVVNGIVTYPSEEVHGV